MTGWSRWRRGENCWRWRSPMSRLRKALQLESGCPSCFEPTSRSSGSTSPIAGAEEALYESPVLRRFAGVDLSLAAAPEETAIRHFRQWLDERDLGSRVMAAVNRYLDERGIRITRRTESGCNDPRCPSRGREQRRPGRFSIRSGRRGRPGFHAAPTESAGVYSGAYSMDPETAESEARDRSSGPTRSRVMVKAHSPSPGAAACPLRSSAPTASAAKPQPAP